PPRSCVAGWSCLHRWLIGVTPTACCHIPSRVRRGDVVVSCTPRRACGAKSGLAYEADDVLGLEHVRFGDLACAIGAIDQDRIDMAGVSDQPLHLRGDRRELGDA